MIEAKGTKKNNSKKGIERSRKSGQAGRLEKAHTIRGQTTRSEEE